jgi:hypothetical protein
MAAAATPSHALVNFARLMRSCDELASDLRDEPRRRRLRAYVPALQALWRQLETLSECGWDDLDEYARKVERLAELLDEGRLASGGALAGTRVNSNARLTRKQANEELTSRRTASTRVHQAIRAQLMQSSSAEPIPAQPPTLPTATRAFAPTPQPPVASAAVAAAGTGVAGAKGSSTLAGDKGDSTLDALIARAKAERGAAESEGASGSVAAGGTAAAAVGGSGRAAGAGAEGPGAGGAREGGVAGGRGGGGGGCCGGKGGSGGVGSDGGASARELGAVAGSSRPERPLRSGGRGGEAIAAQSVEATLDAERKMQVGQAPLTKEHATLPKWHGTQGWCHPKIAFWREGRRGYRGSVCGGDAGCGTVDAGNKIIQKSSTNIACSPPKISGDPRIAWSRLTQSSARLPQARKAA